MQIIKGKLRRPRRTMVYGPHGIGKSTFAAMAERPIFVCTEEGTNDLEVDRLPPVPFTDMLQVRAAFDYLLREDHGYKSLVIDTVDWLEKIVFAEVCFKKQVEAIDEIPYNKGPGLAIPIWSWVLEQLDTIRDDKGMDIILLAHAKIEKFADPDTDSYDRYSPDLHKTFSPMVQEWCDEVLFATHKMFIKQKDAGFNRVENKAIGTGERVLKTTVRPSHLAKNRLALPEEIPLDYRVYSQFCHPKKEGTTNGAT